MVVGTWSGSVSERLPVVDVLKLEKIRDDWVSHSNWVLVEVGLEAGLEVISKEFVVDEGGTSGLSEGKLTLSKS